MSICYATEASCRHFPTTRLAASLRCALSSPVTSTDGVLVRFALSNVPQRNVRPTTSQTEEPDMPLKSMTHALCGALLLSLCACGGGGGASQTSSPASTGTGGTTQSSPGSVRLLVSDDSAEDWATIGVKVLSIALLPQGGGSAVTVYSAPSQAPMINLEELDQLAEILGNVSVPAGTYSGAVVTVGGNPGDVALTVAADPEAGFDGTAGATIAASQIQIQ